MPALTPSFLFDFESEMQRITENEMVRLTAADVQWWREVTRVRTTGKKREIIAWLLSTAQIRDQGLGGNINFDDMAATFQEYDVKNAGQGLELTRDQVEDNDGNGFDFASEWSAQAAAQMVYWPQKKITELLLKGTAATSLSYDGVPFFSTAHPLNQFRTSLGTYANLMTGSASPPYPGAVPIDDSVTLDAAYKNLAKLKAYIASIKMPNGVDPRFLKLRGLLVPPRMMAQVSQLASAKFIAQAAGSSAGSGDVEGLVAYLGLGKPIEAQELAGATYADGSDPDKTYFALCEQISTTQLGGFVYLEREPFKITYYTGQGGGTGMDAILDRSRKLEWHLQGRNGTGYGHPYTIIKCNPT